MNQSQIDEFLKQRRKERETKDQIDEFMKGCKDSDFNQNLKMVGFTMSENGGNARTWMHSDRKFECFACGIAADNYRYNGDKKEFACSSCCMKIKD